MFCEVTWAFFFSSASSKNYSWVFPRLFWYDYCDWYESRQVVSIWTCSKLCAICFVTGVVVGYSLKRCVNRWVSKLLRRLKDDWYVHPSPCSGMPVSLFVTDRNELLSCYSIRKETAKRLAPKFLFFLADWPSASAGDSPMTIANFAHHFRLFIISCIFLPLLLQHNVTSHKLPCT